MNPDESIRIESCFESVNRFTKHEVTIGAVNYRVFSGSYYRYDFAYRKVDCLPIAFYPDDDVVSCRKTSCVTSSAVV